MATQGTTVLAKISPKETGRIVEVKYGRDYNYSTNISSFQTSVNNSSSNITIMLDNLHGYFQTTVFLNKVQQQGADSSGDDDDDDDNNCNVNRKFEDPPTGRGSQDAGKKTVMVCDDEKGIRDIFEFLLKEKYNVLTVNSGNECVQKFEDEKRKGRDIDVLILDYRLGDVLGDNVARKIRELNGTKVILISAYQLESEMIARLKEEKYIADFMRKPVDANSLMRKIEESA
jgi:CheY-like chemotaxis protein